MSIVCVAGLESCTTPSYGRAFTQQEISNGRWLLGPIVFLESSPTAVRGDKISQAAKGKTRELGLVTKTPPT